MRQIIRMTGMSSNGHIRRMRYSAAYPTGAERVVFSRVEHVERVDVFRQD